MNQCERCSGTGETQFRHVEDGVCFECGGSGQTDRVARRARNGSFCRHDHDSALVALRLLYRNARRDGSTLQDMIDAATGVTELLDLAPETKPHFAALGWPV